MEPEEVHSYQPEPEETHVHHVAAPRRRRRRRPVIGFIALIFIVACNLLLGAIGGAAGFVLLANNNSSFLNAVRDKLGINDGTGVAVPVRQSIHVEESSAVIDASKKVSPAVVSISASQQVADFYGNVSTQEVAGGTGFIITSDGLIVTNKHVVAEGTSYKVILSDGTVLDAKIQATDPYDDLAFVKVDGHDLPTVEIGDSDAMQIGQYVLAIGNALGEFKNSVTLGVVSAKQRSIDASSGSSTDSTQGETLTGLLQTDAAINPGNSGGPLVNLAGQVIGINTAIASSGTGGGSIGVGFAIPINSVKVAIESVRKTGAIARPYIGVRYAVVTKALQQLNKLPVDYGALVSRGTTAAEVAVVPGSPADKAGIKENDIILEINGERIDEDNSLQNRLEKYEIGNKVTLKIMRAGKEMTVSVTLEKIQ